MAFEPLGVLSDKADQVVCQWPELPTLDPLAACRWGAIEFGRFQSDSAAQSSSALRLCTQTTTKMPVVAAADAQNPGVKLPPHKT